MEKEFKLSEKIVLVNLDEDYPGYMKEFIPTKDVKEFIKLLIDYCSSKKKLGRVRMIYTINKLAGGLK